MLPYTVTFLVVAAIIAGNLLIRSAFLLQPARYAVAETRLELLTLLARSWRVALGAMLVFGGIVGWVMTVSLWHLDASYMALGLSYVITIVCAWWFMGETLTLEKMFGAIIMVIGILLIVRNSGL